MTHDQKIELLKLLKEYPMSTTSFLFKAACECSASQIPDPSSLSKIIYEARGKGLLTTSDAGKAKVHTITRKGVEELMKNEQQDSVIEHKVFVYDPVPVQETVEIEQTAPTEQEQIDPVDHALNALVDEIRNLRRNQSRVIDHKQQKIDTLTRLGNLMSDDIKLIFDQIIDDLEA